MGKSNAPKVDRDGLTAYCSNNDLNLIGLRERFLQLEDLRRAQKIATPHIAFEVLTGLLGGRMEGYSDEQLRDCWPKDWGADAVSIPASVLHALASLWIEYNKDKKGRTIGEVFKLEGGGQGRSRSITAQKKRDLHRNYANEVAKRISIVPGDDRTLTPADAIEEVAAEFEVSFETVESAYKSHCQALYRVATERKILKGVKTS
jgi:hypothetical protein